MHYEINISKDGSHYLGIHTRSVSFTDEGIAEVGVVAGITDKEKAAKVFAELQAKYPESEGYKVSVYKIYSMSQLVKF